MRDNPDESAWELSVGLYQGILIGIRSYPNELRTDHVIYLPFIDLCLTIYHGEAAK